MVLGSTRCVVVISKLIHLRAKIRRELNHKRKKWAQMHRASFIDEDSGSYDKSHYYGGQVAALEFCHAEIISLLREMKNKK